MTVKGMLARVRDCRGAAVVRALAGVPAGVERSRRGTVLVLILGALALVAVITLVYTTLGQSDRRVAAVTVRKDNINRAVETVARYLAQIPADDVLSTRVDGQDASGNPVLVREVSDYPWTDPSYRSVNAGLTGSGPPEARRFNPAGSHSLALTSTPDLRFSSDPWLAAHEPVAMEGGSRPLPGDFAHWLAITNAAPDGRPVNLVNLRPERGGFDARAGYATNEMSFDLGLLDANGNFTQQRMDGLNVTAPDVRNTPATWSVAQLNLFRPAVDRVHSPSGRDYLPYQYADTDGDGVLDSRIFEMVDLWDPSNPVSLLADERYRWFVAARIVDLSGLANVNTATDFVLAPRDPASSADSPAGLTPADIDLRRLLTLDDLTYQDFQWGGGFSYDSLYFTPPNAPWGTTAADNYGPGANSYSAADALKIGSGGYNALRKVLTPNDIAPPEYGGPAMPGGILLPDGRTRHYLDAAAHEGSVFVPSGTGATLRRGAAFGMADLLELLARRATNSPETSRLENILDSKREDTVVRGPGPLRSNRSQGQETAVDLLTGGLAGLGDGTIDPPALARLTSDIRHLVTTVSGSRMLRSTIVANPNVLGPTERRVDAVKALDDTIAVTTSGSVTRPNLQQRDPLALFRGYAEALSPAAGQQGYWNAARQRLRSMAYGYEPELALRTAAFMAANLIDAADEDGYPSAFTLLLRGTDRGNIAGATLPGGAPAFSHWNTAGTGNAHPGRMDVDDDGNGGLVTPSRLAAAGDPLYAGGGGAGPGAINVFGVEAQPFVVEMLSFVVYTDAPPSHGGDDDEVDPTVILAPITIDGSDTDVATNGDYLGEIIAFKLTNPFDVRIELTQQQGGSSSVVVDADYSDYYIEYGGSYFKLAKVDPATNELEAVTLEPHESRVFFCTNVKYEFLKNRWQALVGASAITEAFQAFIDNQLAVELTPGTSHPASEILSGTNGQRLKPVQIRRINKSTGTTYEHDPNSPGPQPDPVSFFERPGDKQTAAHLWRTIRNQFDPVGGGAANRPENDLLVDRLRDPRATAGQRPVLDRRIDTSDHDVTGTTSGQEGDPSYDNTGFTICLFGSVRRHDEPTGGNTPLGAIPACCIEGKWVMPPAGGGASQPLANVRRADPVSGNPPHLAKANFQAPIGSKRFDGAVGSFIAMVTTDGNAIVPTMTRRPQTDSANPMPQNLDGRDFVDLRVQLLRDDKEFKRGAGAGPDLSILRLTDLLLPLGIGPFQDPSLFRSILGDAAFASVGREEHTDWVTLSEALGLALNYSTPQPGDPLGLYADFGAPRDPAAPTKGAADRGNLSLDWFVPFEDLNGNGVMDVGEVRSPGIPLALNVLNGFHTSFGKEDTGGEFGGLTRAVPGLVNINTAPPSVQRLLPLIAPTTEASNQVWNAWKMAAGLPPAPGTIMGPATSPGATDGTDLAASFTAYRDRRRVHDRDGRVCLFDDSTGFNPFLAPAPSANSGRYLTTRIPGLREGAGFGSIGEFLAVVDHSGTGGAPGGRLGSAIVNGVLVSPNAIDALAFDRAASGSRATNTVLHRDPSNAMGPLTVDRISDDWSEKLIAAAALGNTASVSSDYYAIYFVLQGYQRSDCEDLGPNDPLVPSVAKRFLMVIDRSQVTRKGQAPRVLLFTELPM